MRADSIDDLLALPLDDAFAGAVNARLVRDESERRAVLVALGAGMTWRQIAERLHQPGNYSYLRKKYSYLADILEKHRAAQPDPAAEVVGDLPDGDPPPGRRSSPAGPRHADNTDTPC